MTLTIKRYRTHPIDVAHLVDGSRVTARPAHTGLAATRKRGGGHLVRSMKGLPARDQRAGVSIQPLGELSTGS